jgi:hypothetical protein
MGLERYPPLSEPVRLRHSEIMRDAMADDPSAARFFARKKSPRRSAVRNLGQQRAGASPTSPNLGRDAVPPSKPRRANERHRPRSCDRDLVVGVRFWADSRNDWERVPLSETPGYSASQKVLPPAAAPSESGAPPYS